MDKRITTVISENRWFLGAFVGVSTAYLASFFSAGNVTANAALGSIVVLAVILAFTRSFTLGMAVVLSELVAGSLGRLFTFPVGGLSVRMALLRWSWSRPPFSVFVTGNHGNI